ncbi:Protein of unknown function [Polaromonas sp. YR568]|uniref:DUF1353 domain-containing protein n=1 Tax=Polaromonas sp. YR568 TaxID=1855301 RepID=UPI0008E5C662|nr:DUF1353 domain-containing protein [Polaromonas sp. YR568]SFU87941.1 Protein of unknown function [Polaromonas sp. YR568]
MSDLNKRNTFGYLIATLAGACLPTSPAFAQPVKSPVATGLEPASNEIDDWMKGWMDQKALGDPLVVQRFVEPIYFLAKPIQWRPAQASERFKEVVVPTGFVTDLASIPRLFWSVLRPDGDYAYAAIVHDYLYWEQSPSIPRSDADEIFRLAMKDLDVSTVKSTVIFNAVRSMGESAWNRNTELKAQGERRLLKRFPTSAVTRWEDWKKRTDVF